MIPDEGPQQHSDGMKAIKSVRLDQGLNSLNRQNEFPELK